jgi:predicted ATPase with chaperone activity
VDVTSGLPSFGTAGLPESTVRESRDRVRAAMRNPGLEFPIERITLSLARRPAEGEDFASRGPGLGGKTS